MTRTCRIASRRPGRRIAVVGAGPTGLAAAYYLRRLGHDCVSVREDVAGGRAFAPRDDSRGAATRHTRCGDRTKSCGWGSRCDGRLRFSTKAALDELCEQFDAVLMACGDVESQQVEAWGLDSVAARHRVSIATPIRPNAQACLPPGTSVRGKALVVRSTADGKEVAQTIDQFVSGREVRGPSRPFSSRIHKVTEEEMAEFLAGAGSACRSTPESAEPISGIGVPPSKRIAVWPVAAWPTAAASSNGTRSCTRRTPVDYDGQRRPYEVIGRHGIGVV